MNSFAVNTWVWSIYIYIFRYSVKFTPNEAAKGRLTLWGGPLGDDRFRLEQLHFHWGSEDQRGSEHSINGHRYGK